MDKQAYKHGKSAIRLLSESYIPGTREQIEFAQLFKSIEMKSSKVEEHARAVLRHTMFYITDYDKSPDNNDMERYALHHLSQDFIVTMLKERNPDIDGVIPVTTKDGEYHEIHLFDDED